MEGRQVFEELSLLARILKKKARKLKEGELALEESRRTERKLVELQNNTEIRLSERDKTIAMLSSDLKRVTASLQEAIGNNRKSRYEIQTLKESLELQTKKCNSMTQSLRMARDRYERLKSAQESKLNALQTNDRYANLKQHQELFDASTQTDFPGSILINYHDTTSETVAAPSSQIIFKTTDDLGKLVDQYCEIPALCMNIDWRDVNLMIPELLQNQATELKNWIIPATEIALKESNDCNHLFLNLLEELTDWLCDNDEIDSKLAFANELSNILKRNITDDLNNGFITTSLCYLRLRHKSKVDDDMLGLLTRTIPRILSQPHGRATFLEKLGLKTLWSLHSSCFDPLLIHVVEVLSQNSDSAKSTIDFFAGIDDFVSRVVSMMERLSARKDSLQMDSLCRALEILLKDRRLRSSNAEILNWIQAFHQEN